MTVDEPDNTYAYSNSTLRTPSTMFPCGRGESPCPFPFPGNCKDCGSTLAVALVRRYGLVPEEAGVAIPAAALGSGDVVGGGDGRVRTTDTSAK
jgi:hypothetical protein